MAGFRKGDIPILIAGKPYALRLTVGALAEIDHRLAVSGPLELAEKLQNLSANAVSADTAFILLECLLRPALSSPFVAGLADIPTIARQADPQDFLAHIAALFETNLKEAANE